MSSPRLRLLHDEAAIATRVRELAAAIDERAPAGDLHVVGLLTGSFVFVADLVRELWRRGRDTHVMLLRASHYGSGRHATGDVHLGEVPPTPAGDRVLVVDDILDSGHTLSAALAVARSWHPAWLATCVLLDKPSGRKVPVEAEFVGFPAPAAWVVGYGLDLEGGLRGLPHLSVLVEEPSPAPDAPRSAAQRDERESGPGLGRR